MNPNPLSDVFKAKVTSLIQEQLKPIVTELASQQQIILTHLALLKHNHNVNDYQMTRLENIRDLEQSINFKVSGVLGFDPWQHSSIGTNLREPVPADPRLIPQFIPIDQASPAERAAKSAALIEEAGMSARQIGVPLTLQDFPGHPSMSKGGKAEDPMHAAIPLFGLNAPRWRAMQGLEDHPIPGTAAYDGVVVPPVEKAGRQLYDKRAKQLKRPMWEQGADPLGIGAASSSPIPGTGTSHSSVPAAGAIPFNTTPVARPPAFPSSSSTPFEHPKLYRTYAIADIESTIRKAPKLSSLRRTSTMASIGSTVSTNIAISTTATIGSEPPSPRTVPTAKAKAKKQQSTSKQRTTRTKTAAAATTASASSSSTAPAQQQPKRVATLKRGRQAAETDDATTENIANSSTGTNTLQPRAEVNNQEKEGEEAEPARKRRKPAAPNTHPTTTGDGYEAGQGQPRRSTRVTRASAAGTRAEAVPPPAPRGRATKGKKGSKRS